MSSLTIDEKLHLIEKMRNSTTTMPNLPARSVETFDSDLELSSNGFRYLKYRILVCLFIFSAFFGLYKMNFEVKGHKVTEVAPLLEENLLPEQLQKSLESFSNKMIENSSLK